MLSGRFAQRVEFVSLALIVLGILALCQPFSKWLFSHGFTLLFWGWLGLTIFSHRKPVR